jgi:hypothetical protein
VRIRGGIARAEGGGAGAGAGLWIRDFFGAGLPYAHVHSDTKKIRCPVLQIMNQGHRKKGMENRYRERGCGYVANCGFGGADGVLHTMSGSWDPTTFRDHQSAIRLITVPQHCTTN